MEQAKLVCPLCGGNLTNQGQDLASNVRMEYQGDTEAKVRYFVCDKCHRDYEVFDPVKHNQRPDAIPASLSVGAVETKYKKGDHVWAKQPKELAGRTGYVMEVDTRRMEYEVRFGTEIWIVPEDDLELVDPATEEVRQTVFEREDVTDLLTEGQAYDDYQERTAKSGDRADQLAWAIVALLAAQLIGGSKYGEMYVMAAGALAYMLLHTLQSAWQGVAIWIVKQRISRGRRLADYPSWLGGTAWAFYWLKLAALTAAALYGIVHFLRLL